MSSKQTYKNCEIRIENDQRLFINQKEIEYEYDRIQNKWSSRYLPYTQYNSLDDLAKAIIVDTVEFNA